MAVLAQTALGGDLAHAGRRLDTIGIGAADLDDARRAMDAIRARRAVKVAVTAVDADLRSIAAARRAAERAFEAWQKFRGTPPETIDAMVEAVALAIEPEAERLARLAVEETGHGNVPDKRIKNLFNALSVAEWLRNVRTLGVLWRDEAAKVAAIGEPMGVVAALVPVTNPTSTVIFKTLSALKAGNAIVCAPHPRGVKCGAATAEVPRPRRRAGGRAAGTRTVPRRGDDPGYGGADAPSSHVGGDGDRRRRDGAGRLLLRQADPRGRPRQRAGVRAPLDRERSRGGGRADRRLQELRLRHRLCLGAGGDRGRPDRPRTPPRDEASGGVLLHLGGGGPARRRPVRPRRGHHRPERRPVGEAPRRPRRLRRSAPHPGPGGRAGGDRTRRSPSRRRS